MLEKVNNQL